MLARQHQECLRIRLRGLGRLFQQDARLRVATRTDMDMGLGEVDRGVARPGLPRPGDGIHAAIELAPVDAGADEVRQYGLAARLDGEGAFQAGYGGVHFAAFARCRAVQPQQLGVSRLQPETCLEGRRGIPAASEAIVGIPQVLQWGGIARFQLVGRLENRDRILRPPGPVEQDAEQVRKAEILRLLRLRRGSDTDGIVRPADRAECQRVGRCQGHGRGSGGNGPGEERDRLGMSTGAGVVHRQLLQRHGVPGILGQPALQAGNRSRVLVRGSRNGPDRGRALLHAHGRECPRR